MQQRIVEETSKLFMKYGIRSISMDEIAQHLSISKKTIYQYYKDKDDLVNAVINKEIERNQQMSCEIQACCKDAIHEIFIAIAGVEELFKTMNLVLIFDLKKYHVKAYKTLLDFKRKHLLALVKDNLKRGIKEGLYRENINIEVLSLYRVETIFMILNNETFEEHKIDRIAIIFEISENFMLGIATPKGAKQLQKYKQQRLK